MVVHRRVSAHTADWAVCCTRDEGTGSVGAWVGCACGRSWCEHLSLACDRSASVARLCECALRAVSHRGAIGAALLCNCGTNECHGECIVGAVIGGALGIGWTQRLGIADDRVACVAFLAECTRRAMSYCAIGTAPRCCTVDGQPARPSVRAVVRCALRKCWTENLCCTQDRRTRMSSLAECTRFSTSH